MPTKLWGSIRYNKIQGAWCVSGRYQGQQLYYSGFNSEIGFQKCTSRDQAVILQSIISKEIADGKFNPLRYKRQKQHHIEKYADKWIESIKPEVSYSTWKSYRAAVTYIKQGLGDIYIGDLSYNDIKKWINEMVLLDKHGKPQLTKDAKTIPLHLKTRKNYQGVLIRMMKDAIRNGDIAQLPEFVVWKGGRSIPAKKKEWIEKDMQHRILEKIPEPDRYIFKFLMATGVRVSEARALRWSDVYRDRGFIYIRNTFAPTTGGEILKEVKQKREREIPFYAALNEWWDNIPRYLKSEFVFNWSKTGRPYTKNINRDVWNPACREAIGYVFPLNNAGRHSFANQLSMEGVDMKIIAKLLGHSDNGKTAEAHYADPATAVMGRIVDGVRK